jgi:hypothetical protein
MVEIHYTHASICQAANSSSSINAGRKAGGRWKSSIRPSVDIRLCRAGSVGGDEVADAGGEGYGAGGP